MKAKRDRAVRAGQYRYLHATLLGACGGVIDMLLLAGVSVEEPLGNVPRRFAEVICHAVRRGAALALTNATLRSGEDLRNMTIGFPPVE